MMAEKEKEFTAHLAVKMIECDVPVHMQESLLAYIMKGRPVGSFLAAVLNNNLREACNRADEENLKHITDYVRFLYNYAPMACWGYETATTDWPKRLREIAKQDAARTAAVDAGGA